MDRPAVILLAEDDPNDVFFLRRAFQRALVQCQIQDVPNGQEAILYLSGEPPYNNRADFPMPDLVLLDLKMPLADGFDVLDWLRQRPELAEVPAVVLSSSAHHEDVNRARDLGARDYHVKPSDMSQLVSFVGEIAAKWLRGSSEK